VREGACRDVAAEEQDIVALGLELSENRLQRREVAVNVVEGGD
jgi:hypothetical protein